MSVTERNKKRLLLGQDNNALTWLIIINSIVFVVLLFIKLIYQVSSDNGLVSFQTQIADWFALPASGSKLLARPWTILSYMFSHDNLWYLISSVLWLWCFGFILQELAGNNKLVPIYLYGGVVGGIIFILSANLLPNLRTDIQFLSEAGAASAVFAIAVGTTALAPDYRLFHQLNGGIPLWVLTIVYVAIDFATIGSENIAVTISHIAAGAAGFLFIKQLKKGNDLGLWMNNFANWINDLFNPEKKYQTDQLYYKPTRKPYQKTLHVTQQRLDEILDKINQQGYQLLTEDEKEFLKKASNTDL
jgi:membrane associated rhomboid family serine protease